MRKIYKLKLTNYPAPPDFSLYRLGIPINEVVLFGSFTTSDGHIIITDPLQNWVEFVTDIFYVDENGAPK